MAKKKQFVIIHQTIIADGHLEEAEALAALRSAAEAATILLTSAIVAGAAQQEIETLMAERDCCQLAYLQSLNTSLRHTGPYFEKIAQQLNNTAKEIEKKAASLTAIEDAVNLLTSAAELATKLAIAFA